MFLFKRTIEHAVLQLYIVFTHFHVVDDAFIRNGRGVVGLILSRNWVPRKVIVSKEGILDENPKFQVRGDANLLAFICALLLSMINFI